MKVASTVLALALSTTACTSRSSPPTSAAATQLASSLPTSGTLPPTGFPMRLAGTTNGSYLGPVGHDGGLVAIDADGTPDDSCPRVRIRLLDGSFQLLDQPAPPYCAASVAQMSVNSEYLVAVVATPEVAGLALASWRILAFDRRDGSYWVVAENKPDQPPVAALVPRLSGRRVTWREVNRVPPLGAKDISTFVADLRSRSVAVLPVSLNNPTIVGSSVFGVQYPDPIPTTTSSRLVRYDLESGQLFDLGDGFGNAEVVATDTVVWLSSRDYTEVRDHQGRVLATSDAHGGYATAGEHLIVWQDLTDAASQRFMGFDTRCNKEVVLHEADTQGPIISAAGPFVSWQEVASFRPGESDVVDTVLSTDIDLAICQR